MTSTNDGKDVKSNQTSGQKGKSYYIELYKSIDARLSGECGLGERTQHLCEAWRRVHSLCLHSAPATHPHLLSWLQRHTARTVLHTKWSKEEQDSLEEAIDAFIEETKSERASKDGVSPPWETQLLQRGQWFKRVLANPWGHPVLRTLLDPNGEPPTNDEILEWLKEERGVMFLTRLRQLATSKCADLAVLLVTAVMDRVRASTELVPDSEQNDEPKDKPKQPADPPTFADVLTSEAGFTLDVWELLTDIEFVLLHKGDRRSKCIELAKQTPLRNGYQLVERLQGRLETSPREKKLWKNAKEVATLIAQVVIARCMVVPVCNNVSRTALYCCSRSLVRLLPPGKLEACAAALAAPAHTARHLHTLAAATLAQCTADMKPFVCELYVRAITAGMNELERLKLDADKAAEARSQEQTLATWFTQLGSLVSGSARLQCECALTAFSVHPSPALYGLVQQAPALPRIAAEKDVKEETNSEFGSWATDSRTQTNLVKTSETLNLKQTQHQANVLSTAILNEGEALGLSPEMCQDLAVLLSGPRVKTFSWDMDREFLLENCRAYMERTHGGTRALTTELKYLNLDPRSYQHLPEEDDAENDAFYGIEKGYEHLVEIQEQEEIWQDAYSDPERTESACSSTSEVGTTTLKKKKKKKPQVLSSEEDSDPLSLVAEAKRTEKKKERPHSKERSKEKKEKKKSKSKDDKEKKESSRERRKEGEKEKKPRKKKTKEQIPVIEHKPGSLSSLIGMKVAKVKIPEGKYKKNVDTNIPCITDIDYDSQGKSSLASLNSEGNDPDVLFDGLYNMEDYRSPEKGDPLADRSTYTSEFSVSNGKVAFNTASLLRNDNRLKLQNSRLNEAHDQKSQQAIREEVKKSISRLIEFRRQKSLLEETQILKSLSSPISTYSDKSVSPKSSPIVRPSTDNALIIKSPNAIIRPEFPEPSVISPKAVEVPEIPKAYINKKTIEPLNEPRQGVNTTHSKYLNKPLLHNQAAVPTCESSFQQYVLNKQQINTPYSGIGTNQKKSSVSVIHSSVDDSDKEIQRSFQDFLRELQESINAGTGANKKPNTLKHVPPRKEVKPISRVTPVVPYTSQIEPGTSSQCAKSTIHSAKKVDNQLNTFSRLSYMHKNKQTDGKFNKQSAELSNQELMVSRCVEDQKSAKIKYLQSKGDISIRVGQNAHYSPKDEAQVIIRKVDKPTPTTLDHPVLMNMLQGNHAPVPKQKPKETQSRSVPSAGYRPEKPFINTSLSEKDQNDLLLLLRQQNKLNSPLSFTSPDVNKIVNNPQYTKNTGKSNTASMSHSQVTPITSINRHQRTEIKSNTIEQYEGCRVRTVHCDSLPGSNIVSLDYKTGQSSKTSNKKVDVTLGKVQNVTPCINRESNKSFSQTYRPQENISHIAEPKKQSIMKNVTKSESLLKPNITLTKVPIVTCQATKQSSSLVTPPTKAHCPSEEPQDWESVMDALLSHKTPSLGPNALDVALKKDSFAKTALRNQRIVRKKELANKQYNSANSNVTPASNKNINTEPVVADLSMKKPIQKDKPEIGKVEPPKRLTDNLKLLPCEAVKEKDPFISGIPNSDYDLIEELMDDELRKEIGELSSDEESYRGPTAGTTKVIKIAPASKCTNVANNSSHQDRLASTNTRSSNIVQNARESILQTNKRAVIKTYDATKNKSLPQPMNITNTKPQTHANVIVDNKQKIIENLKISCTKIQGPVVNALSHIANSEEQSYNVDKNRSQYKLADERNIVITPTPIQVNSAIKSTPVAPKVVVIGSDVIYDPFTVAAVQTPVHPGLCNVNQSPFIALNTAPSLTVYQTTQFAAPVVNPVIIGSAITVPSCERVPEITPMPSLKQPQDLSGNKVGLQPPKPPQDCLEESIENLQNKGKNDKTMKDTNAKSKLNNCQDCIPEQVISSPEDSKTNLDINSNKNSERKVLSEVQDKQEINHSEKIDSIVTKILKLSTDSHVKKEVLKEQEKPQTEFKSQNQPNILDNNTKQVNAKDLERIMMKRLAILNRTTFYRSSKPPIALKYESLTSIKQKIANMSKLGEDDSNIPQSTDICEATTVNNSITTGNVLNYKIESKKDDVNSDNSKENDTNSIPCRRILLRSSNELKTMILTSNVQVQRNHVGRKTKVRLKSETKVTEEDVEKKSDSDVNDNKERKDTNANEDDTDSPKRVSMRILNRKENYLKKIKHDDNIIKQHSIETNKKNERVLKVTKKDCDASNEVKNNVQPEELVTGQTNIIDKTSEVNDTSNAARTEAELGMIDVEDTLLGSKIPKIKEIISTAQEKSNIEKTSAFDEVIPTAETESNQEHVGTKPGRKKRKPRKNNTEIKNNANIGDINVNNEKAENNVAQNKDSIFASPGKTGVTISIIRNKKGSGKPKFGIKMIDGTMKPELEIRKTKGKKICNKQVSLLLGPKKAVNKKLETKTSSDDAVKVSLPNSINVTQLTTKSEPKTTELRAKSVIPAPVASSPAIYNNDAQHNDLSLQKLVPVRDPKDNSIATNKARDTTESNVFIINDKSINNNMSRSSIVTRQTKSKECVNIVKQDEKAILLPQSDSVTERVLNLTSKIAKVTNTVVPSKVPSATENIVRNDIMPQNIDNITTTKTNPLTPATITQMTNVTSGELLLKPQVAMESSATNITPESVVTSSLVLSKTVIPQPQNNLVHKKTEKTIQQPIKEVTKKASDMRSTHDSIEDLKEKIVIEELPSIPNDPSRKCVRIKLPNGKTFKATVFGRMHVSFDSIFADPALKSTLLSNLNDTRRYTVNIKQVSTSAKNDPQKIVDARIEEVNIHAREEKPIETVDLLSDDEEETKKMQTFKTEFGKYNIVAINDQDFQSHLKKLQQKCFVKLMKMILSETCVKTIPRIPPCDSGKKLKGDGVSLLNKIKKAMDGLDDLNDLPSVQLNTNFDTGINCSNDNIDVRTTTINKPIDKNTNPPIVLDDDDYNDENLSSTSAIDIQSDTLKNVTSIKKGVDSPIIFDDDQSKDDKPLSTSISIDCNSSKSIVLDPKSSEIAIKSDHVTDRKTSCSILDNSNKNNIPKTTVNNRLDETSSSPVLGNDDDKFKNDIRNSSNQQINAADDVSNNEIKVTASNEQTAIDGSCHPERECDNKDNLTTLISKAAPKVISDVIEIEDSSNDSVDLFKGSTAAIEDTLRKKIACVLQQPLPDKRPKEIAKKPDEGLDVLKKMLLEDLGVELSNVGSQVLTESVNVDDEAVQTQIKTTDCVVRLQKCDDLAEKYEKKRILKQKCFVDLVRCDDLILSKSHEIGYFDENELLENCDDFIDLEAIDADTSLDLESTRSRSGSFSLLDKLPDIFDYKTETSYDYGRNSPVMVVFDAIAALRKQSKAIIEDHLHEQLDDTPSDIYEHGRSSPVMEIFETIASYRRFFETKTTEDAVTEKNVCFCEWYATKRDLHVVNVEKATIRMQKAYVNPEVKDNLLIYQPEPTIPLDHYSGLDINGGVPALKTLTAKLFETDDILSRLKPFKTLLNKGKFLSPHKLKRKLQNSGDKGVASKILKVVMDIASQENNCSIPLTVIKTLPNDNTLCKPSEEKEPIQEAKDPKYSGTPECNSSNELDFPENKKINQLFNLSIDTAVLSTNNEDQTNSSTIIKFKETTVSEKNIVLYENYDNRDKSFSSERALAQTDETQMQPLEKCLNVAGVLKWHCVDTNDSEILKESQLIHTNEVIGTVTEVRNVCEEKLSLEVNKTDNKINTKESDKIQSSMEETLRSQETVRDEDINSSTTVTSETHSKEEILMHSNAETILEVHETLCGKIHIGKESENKELNFDQTSHILSNSDVENKMTSHDSKTVSGNADMNTEQHLISSNPTNDHIIQDIQKSTKVELEDMVNLVCSSENQLQYSGKTEQIEKLSSCKKRQTEFESSYVNQQFDLPETQEQSPLWTCSSPEVVIKTSHNQDGQSVNIMSPFNDNMQDDKNDNIISYIDLSENVGNRKDPKESTQHESKVLKTHSYTMHNQSDVKPIALDTNITPEVIVKDQTNEENFSDMCLTANSENKLIDVRDQILDEVVELKNNCNTSESTFITSESIKRFSAGILGLDVKSIDKNVIETSRKIKTENDNNLEDYSNGDHTKTMVLSQDSKSDDNESNVIIDQNNELPHESPEKQSCLTFEYQIEVEHQTEETNDELVVNVSEEAFYHENSDNNCITILDTADVQKEVEIVGRNSAESIEIGQASCTKDPINIVNVEEQAKLTEEDDEESNVSSPEIKNGNKIQCACSKTLSVQMLDHGYAIKVCFDKECETSPKKTAFDSCDPSPTHSNSSDGKNRNEVVLNGIEYEDPVIGTCYVFPIAESPTDFETNTDVFNDTEEIIQVIQEIGEDGTVDNVRLETKEVPIEEPYFKLNIPKQTYSRYNVVDKIDSRFSRKSLKRKIDMTDIRSSGKKYRKGKNIDYPKTTAVAILESAYSKEYKQVFDYCSSLKFSYSQPFHKDFIDVEHIIKDWPIQGECSSDFQNKFDGSDLLFSNLDIQQYKIEFDPMEQSLAEELNAEYRESDLPSSSATENIFNKGFGEGSDRVIQNLEDVGDDSKFSAATLSDVKQPQPFLLSEDCEHNHNNTSEKMREDQIKQLRRYITYIQMRDKVRSFFKKTTVELKYDWMKKHKKEPSTSIIDERELTNFPFDLYNATDFMEPPPADVFVQVVQVGQLPVSAAAQNPVTCDPRVTQVSDASPSQCSVDNSPQDDSQPSIKTEYTELTTADLSHLPLMQEYAQHNQTMPMESQEQSNIPIADENIPIETEMKSVVKIELMEETEVKEEQRESYENSDSPVVENRYVNNMDYSFDTNASNATPVVESEQDFQALYNSSEKHNINESYSVQEQQQPKQNGTPEKTDQIAHAMNAAGITTIAETMTNTTRAQALVNILSQKLRQGSVGGQSTTNNFTKTTSINAMSLQQALAQILPPPLNQTNSTENNQQNQNPQVLHIVQGKNASGSQITLVDNSQQSVINGPNATPVLHIVQNKPGTTATSNGAATQQTNSFSGLSLVDAGLQQGGNQLLHIVNTGNQKNSSATGQLLKRVNLLTNLANVQGSNEQKMVQFVCKSADGKSIQLNAPHQRSMVLRLQPIETPNVQATSKSVENPELSPTSSPANSLTGKDAASQQEIKSRSVYEENYAKFIQNSSTKTTVPEKSTSLPKFNQAFGKPVFQDGSQKQNDINSNNSHLSVNTNSESGECQSSDNAINLDHIGQISSPPLLLRKSPAQTSQSQANLVQQIKQAITPMNIQTMHGGVIYTRQIPVNIGGGQTINLITVPSTELVDESGQKQQPVGTQNEMEPSIIKIVPQNQSVTNSEISSEDGNAQVNVQNESNQNTNPQPQPVLTQMRIKLPMLSKTPQMMSGARVVRPSFFQIQRNVIGGANQPVYQQLVLTAAPPLGQQTIRLPQAQTSRPIKVPTENQSSAESQMSSSTLEQLREFDMVLEQVKERSSVPPNSTSNTFPKLHTPSTDTTDGSSASSTTTETTQQVLYSIGNNHQPLNVAYVNRKATVTTPTTSTFVRSPDSSGIVDSPTSSTHVQIPHTVTTDSSHTEQSSQPKPKVSSKSKSRPKTSSNPPSSLKINTVPPKTSAQKPLEDEQTTQRILYILAEYKEQVENSPDKDKPAPRRRSNPPSNPSGSSKRKKSSSGSRRHGARDLSPIHGEDTCRTMGSEDSSCGTSQGDCNESCLDSHSPQDSPRKVVRKLTFEHEIPPPQPRPQPQRNVIVADGQTITVARGTAGKPATAVLMPANYILPVSMVKGGQQIAIVTNRGPKLLTVGGGEGATNALLLQRLIGPAGLKPVLTRPGVRHVRLPTAALHNLQAFNLAAATTVQPPDSTASPAPAPTPPELVDTRATSSPWTDRDCQDVKPERGSSPEGSEPWHLQSSGDPHEYSYEETVRADNLDRTVLVVQKKDGHRQHRLTHVSAAALRHKYAILEHELRLQKSLSEECEDLGVDSPSASELFPEAELLFAASPAHEHTQDQPHHSHTSQPTILNQSCIPQPDIDDQIATDQLLTRNDLQDEQQELQLGLEDVGMVGAGLPAALDAEEFARAHPNTTFHSEPTDDGEVQPFTIAGLKGRHITSTIFHSNRAPATVLMTAPQTTVISQATADGGGHSAVKYDIDNMINSLPSSNGNNINLSSVLVKDDGLTRFDSILSDSRELHLSNTASAIVHSAGNATQVIRRVCYDDDKRDRFLMDEPDALIAGDDAKMIAEDSSRDATLESMPGDADDDRSSPERHAELFWESNSERSESRRPLDFSSDSEKCCKSPSYDETNSTDSSGVGTHMRLDSVIKDARGMERSGSADGSSADDAPPLRTYPAKRHPLEARSVSGKTRAGEGGGGGGGGDGGGRRASGRGVVKRGCHCCGGSPAPPRPKKPRQRKPPMDFTN